MKKYLLSLLFVLLPTVLMAQAAGGAIKRHHKENVAKKQNPRQQKSKPSQSAKPAKVSTDNSQPSVMTEPQMTSAEMLQKGNDYRNQRNYSESLYWYNKAAEKGNSQAKMELYRCYANGWGCSEDKYKAFSYLQEAAKGDCIEAQSLLGFHFFLGNNDSNSDVLGVIVKQDYEEAFYWTKMAAEKNDRLACKHMGWWYKEGIGCTKNIEKAKYWYQKAASLGDKDAKEYLEELK